MQPDNKTTEHSLPSRKPSRQRGQKHNRKAAKKFVLNPPKLANAPAFALNLPSIAAIPQRLIYQKSVVATTKIALSFLDIGLVCEKDMENAETPALFLETIFQRWITEKTASIKNISPRFTLTDSIEAFGESPADGSDPTVTVGISYSEDDAIYRTLKAKIERLEAAVPGLGQTALSKLYTWLCRTMLAISPDFVYSLVQQHHWCGFDDESSYIEEMCEGEDADADILTLTEFEEDYPKLSYRPSEVITADGLRELLSHGDSYIADVAKFLLSEPDRENWDNTARPEYLSDLESENECTGYGLVLNWESGGSDIATRVCNDWLEDSHQGNGCTEIHGVYQFGRDSEGVGKLFASLEQFIVALSWADNAITLLSDEQP